MNNTQDYDAVVYQLSMWAIDNDAELMQQLAEAYWRSIPVEDAEELHKSLFL